jgi:hypothetical protein
MKVLILLIIAISVWVTNERLPGHAMTNSGNDQNSPALDESVDVIQGKTVAFI